MRTIWPLIVEALAERSMLAPSAGRTTPDPKGILPAVFTGIVQHLGTVSAVKSTDFGRSLSVNISGWNHRPQGGESIAVNGCCLTVADIAPINAAVRFDVIAQTLRLTTLDNLAAGDRVNLEHAVTPTTMLGGHIVQGHVDGVGQVISAQRSPAEHRLRISLPDDAAMALIVDKGSIALNGVSLTVASVGGTSDQWFEVALIPTTLALTNLGGLREGDGVNLEYDYIAKIVANWLARRG